MRMQLTEEEAKVILRMREHEAQHRKGWNAALEAAATRFENDKGSFEASYFAQVLRDLKKNV